MRKHLLALALIVGSLASPVGFPVAPGWAQAPPPVPAEPDTERRTRYTGVSNVTSFPVGMDIYGDGIDPTAWVEVWVNGALIPGAGNWAMVPTAGSYVMLSRPLLAANLNVIFTTPQSGTIDIVGARRPRRISQLSNNAGVTARDFNQIVTDLWMTERERWDRASRTVMTPPGETMAFLPPQASRASQGACFDNGGNLTSCVGVPSSTFAAGSGILFTGTGPTTISNNIAAGAGITITGTNPKTIAATASTNARSAYTGTASMQTTDCGKTVALGGSAFYTFTVGAASGFSATCQVLIVNEDSICPSGGAATCREKTVAINGYPSFPLYPGGTFLLVNQNNVWQFQQPGMWPLQALQTWYVCHSAGAQSYFSGGTSGAGTVPSDANDGLSINAPFATIQGALNTIRSQVATNGFGPTIQQCNETFVENNVSAFGALTGTHAFFLQGNPTTPANVCWQVSGSGNAGLTARDYGVIIASGFKFVGTGSSDIGIQTSQWGVIDLRNMEFGYMPLGFHLQIGAGGAINYSSGTYAVTGTTCAGSLGAAPQFTNHIQTIGEGHGVINPPSVSVPNALSFNAWATILGQNYLQLTGITFTGTGAGAGSVGTKYQVQLNGVLNLSGTVLPGATGGTFATGGQITP